MLFVACGSKDDDKEYNNNENRSEIEILYEDEDDKKDDNNYDIAAFFDSYEGHVFDKNGNKIDAIAILDGDKFEISGRNGSGLASMSGTISNITSRTDAVGKYSKISNAPPAYVVDVYVTKIRHGTTTHDAEGFAPGFQYIEKGVSTSRDGYKVTSVDVTIRIGEFTFTALEYYP
jgi:hypothetical protein